MARVGLEAGVQTLRVLYANDYYDPDSRRGTEYIYLDRLRVTEGPAAECSSAVEFEELGPPMHSSGKWLWLWS